MPAALTIILPEQPVTGLNSMIAARFGVPDAIRRREVEVTQKEGMLYVVRKRRVRDFIWMDDSEFMYDADALESVGNLYDLRMACVGELDLKGDPYGDEKENHPEA